METRLSFQETLGLSKRRLREAYNGRYVSKEPYLYDDPTKTGPDGGRLVDPARLTQEMRDAYDKRCGGCRNGRCDWCKHNGCWDELFNPVPDGLLEFCLRGPFNSALVRNECTDAEIAGLVEKYRRSHE